MKRTLCLFIFTFGTFLFSLSPCRAGTFDDPTRKVLSSPAERGSLDDSTIVKGLKEALASSTERAVTEIAKPDGYFGNQRIKILIPDKVRKAADVLGTMGYQQQVDDLVLSMNRAAENAAPIVSSYLGDAIQQITVEDARGILSGGDTAATQFFEKKVRPKFFNDYRPVVMESMEKVGTGRAYIQMLSKYQSVPLASMADLSPFDLNSYVTNKALDGLFTMVGQEEKKIRTNPAAQTTDILKKVFGGK